MFSRAVQSTIWIGILGLSLSTATGLSGRADDDCPGSTYLSGIGLEFEISCNTNFPGDNMADMPVTASDMTDCMESCSLYSPACYGVSYNFTSQSCYYKTSSIYNLTDTETSSDIHSAYAEESLYAADDATCPVTTKGGLLATDDSSLNFTVTCNSTLEGGNFPLIYRLANTLEDCMTDCQVLHPLCLAVTWNPDKTNGFANCQLKSANSSTISSYSPSNYTAFTAELAWPSVNSSCSDNQSVFLESGANYTTHCGSTIVPTTNTTDTSNPYIGDGNAIVNSYSSSLEDCATLCAKNSSCVAVAWNSNLEDGMQNCYLYNGYESIETSGTYHAITIGTATRDSTGSNGTTTATGGGSDSSTSSASTSDSSNSLSGGAIAGIVIGVIALVALVAGAVWFFCRRSRKTNPPTSKELETSTQSQAHPEIDGESVLKPKSFLTSPTEVEAPTSPSDRGVHELPTPYLPAEIATHERYEVSAEQRYEVAA